MLLEYFQMIDRVEAVDLKKGTLRARSVVLKRRAPSSRVIFPACRSFPACS